MKSQLKTPDYFYLHAIFKCGLSFYMWAQCLPSRTISIPVGMFSIPAGAMCITAIMICNQIPVGDTCL